MEDFVVFGYRRPICYVFSGPEMQRELPRALEELARSNTNDMVIIKHLRPGRPVQGREYVGHVDHDVVRLGVHYVCRTCCKVIARRGAWRFEVDSEMPRKQFNFRCPVDEKVVFIKAAAELGLRPGDAMCQLVRRVNEGAVVLEVSDAHCALDRMLTEEPDEIEQILKGEGENVRATVGEPKRGRGVYRRQPKQEPSRAHEGLLARPAAPDGDAGGMSVHQARARFGK